MPIINPLSAIKKSLFKKKIGSSPEDLVYVGEQDQQIQITLIKYNEQTEETIEIKNIEELKEKFDPDKINWINLDGVGNRDLMKELAVYFKFNDLMTSDIMNTEHHPKSEEFDSHLFTTLKMVWLTKENDDIQIIHEHLSIVLGENYVLSFQDKVEGDVFSSVRQRILLNKGKIRQNGVDFLFYKLIDSIVDQFFLVMEYIREEIEDLEDFILSNPSQNMNEQIIGLRRKISELRRLIYMMNGAVKHIVSEGSNFINEDMIVYFKDVLDHTTHLNSDFESFRDYINSIMDMYMSNLSNNLNVIMKTLTIFSLFFVPLTFLAGIYGMNFEYMPELHQKWGYPAILVVMLIVVTFMYIFLKRKKWL
jgi:magnesium transporter